MPSKLGGPTGSPASDGGETADLASTLAALHHAPTPAEQGRATRASRRGALTLALVCLLIAGVIQLATSTPDRARAASKGESRAEVVFSNAKSGTCLNWPVDAPDKPSFVWCTDDHMFEVAKPVEMNNFGEPCQLAVRRYLGDRYDPSSKFTIGVIWPGDAVGTPADARNLLCGLQLLGPDGRPTPFKGKIAELDQSRVWHAGTCLGVDDATGRSTDTPVDCASPHALEVTGAVNLSGRFPGGFPAEPDQHAFLADECGRAADAYLAPRTLSAIGLTISYDTVSPESWEAGSHQVSCAIGRPGSKGWRPEVGSRRIQPMVDGPAPAAPPPPPPPSPSPSEAPPPPVYQEPLVPVAPAATTTQPPAPSPTPTITSTPTTTPVGPPPGPPPGAEPTPSGSAEPQPGVLEIPGLAPITLPWMVPAAPPPPPGA